jgi:hypothetical protein
MRKYLIYYLSKDEDPHVILMLLRHMREKGLPKQINSEVRYLSKVLDDEKNFVDGDHAYYKFKECHEKVMQGKGSYEEDGSLRMMEEQLDQFYLERKLQYYVDNQDRKDLVNAGYDGGEGTYSFSLSPSTKGAQLHHHLLRMLDSGESGQQHFKLADDFIASNKDYFTPEYLNGVYPIMMAKALREIRSGNFSYSGKYIDYVTQLEATGTLLEDDGSVSNTTYLNTIMAAVAGGDFRWARDFTKRYTPNIIDKDRDSISRLGHSLIGIQEGRNIEETQKILPRKLVSTRLYNEELIRQGLKLKIAYGKNQFDVLPERIGNFRNSLKEEEQLSEGQIAASNAFADALLKLAAKESVEVEGLLGKVSFADYMWLRSVVVPQEKKEEKPKKSKDKKSKSKKDKGKKDKGKKSKGK